MITHESRNNPYSLNEGEDGGLGLGQFGIGTAKDRMPNININPNIMADFKKLQKSNLSNETFSDFKYNKLADDERTNAELAVKMTIKQIDWLMKRPYIGNDVARIVAGYNSGVGRVKKAIELWEEEGKINPWTDYLPKKHKDAIKKYIDKMLKKLGKEEEEK